jgi:hypothetical protein
MDINEYAMEHLVRDRLSALRAAAARHALASRAARASDVRMWLGAGLIRTGQWLRGDAMEAPDSQPTG